MRNSTWGHGFVTVCLCVFVGVSVYVCVCGMFHLCIDLATLILYRSASQLRSRPLMQRVNTGVRTDGIGVQVS